MVAPADMTDLEEPSMGIILRSMDVPAIGGDTVFASMTATYAGLSESMRRYIRGLEAVHDTIFPKRRFDNLANGQQPCRDLSAAVPIVIHPVVREHPETRQAVLNVNPGSTVYLYLRGVDDQESRAVLSVLFEQANRPERQYRHRWVPNTVVIWDNRSVQHLAVQDYGERRHLHRVMLKGDRPVPPTSPGLD